MHYVAAVQTAADLERFTDIPVGSVFRVVDTDTYLMWAGEPDPDAAVVPVTPSGRPGLEVTPTAPEPSGWVPVEAGTGTDRGLVDGWWPYVVGSDMVAAYPEVSLDLANKLADFGRDWQTYRNGKHWWTSDGSNALTPGGIVAGGGSAGSLWINVGDPLNLLWRKHGAWQNLFAVDWATYGAPNGPRINAVGTSGQARWYLIHDQNVFTGLFLGTHNLAATRVLTPGPAGLVPPDLEDDKAAAKLTRDTPNAGGLFDMAATIADLVEQVNRLAARIDVLEGTA